MSLLSIVTASSIEAFGNWRRVCFCQQRGNSSSRGTMAERRGGDERGSSWRRDRPPPSFRHDFSSTPDPLSGQRSFHHGRSEDSQQQSRPAGKSSELTSCATSQTTQAKGTPSRQSRSPYKSQGTSKDRATQGLSLPYEAYTHFAVFTCLFLRKTGEKKTPNELVTWYLNEKAQYVPTTIPPAVQSQFYNTLVNNMICDNCVIQSKDENGSRLIEWNPTFMLWAWTAAALEYEASVAVI